MVFTLALKAIMILGSATETANMPKAMVSWPVKMAAATHPIPATRFDGDVVCRMTALNSISLWR
jgi:hypothetical protein